MIVVKIGGSLFDHPNLRNGLNKWLKELASPVHIIPGGGALADEVRRFDAIHHMDADTAHWAAIAVLDANAMMLRALIDRTDVLVVQPYSFCREHDTLPHSWDVTSDSIALSYAMVMNARKLNLLKSSEVPDLPWPVLSAQGIVDRYFPNQSGQTNIAIECVNFREYLDRHRNVDNT